MDSLDRSSGDHGWSETLGEDLDKLLELTASVEPVEERKVRLKPGEPLGCGRLGGVPVLGLPGNPLSVFVGFKLFAEPLLKALSGVAAPWPLAAAPR